MNKTDMIDVIASIAEISKASAGRALDGMLDAISAALAKGDSVTLVGFGTFSVSSRKQRTGRNPRTGETITIPSRKAIKFKAGKELKAKINKGK